MRAALSYDAALDSDLLRVLDEAYARQLPALIAEWLQSPGDRAWIARALRIELALLTEHPELALPCLYRRCAYLGDEDGFYTERPELGPLHALQGRISAWAEHAARPWLRALRPPPIPLDGAVVEEYRTSERGALWADGDRIGVGTVAWERATGRRVAARPPVRAAVAPWERDAEHSWGRCVLVRDGRRVDIAMSPDDFVRAAVALDDDLAVIHGDDLDCEDFYGVIDTRTGRVLWRREGTCTATVVLDHERMLVAREHGIDTVRMTTGERLSGFRCPLVGELVALPDGNVATRLGDVIRVWSVAEALARPQVVHPSTNSWTRAAFSPDGKRLVTGHSLCDAQRGHFIARLATNGPRGWLEGGPPEGCQRLCIGVFAEITPFGLTLWDADTGNKLVSDRERRARAGDCVAFDPRGEYHAIWERGGTLRVHRLREGTLVRELAEPLPDWNQPRVLGFSADGSLLAWISATGHRRVMRLAAPFAVSALAPDEHPWESPPTELRVTDGLLVFGDARIPCDDTTVVVSPDGHAVAGLATHCRLEPRVS